MKAYSFVVGLVAMLGALFQFSAGCKGEDPRGPIDADAKEARGVIQADPKAATPADNRFAVDLYAHLVSSSAAGAESSNLFFSPSSLSIALAMAHAGANGETAAQIAQTLHL